MATRSQKQKEVAENGFRKQLAATVRNIQWSYAIFWSVSTRQKGVLVWNDGYYNGDIKTRKTTQPVEFKADQLGLQRSEQLRELYHSLSSGEGNQQIKRPSASLSPEDLTDTEWYYMICMSFTFSPGQGLPGKAFASNQHIWLSNAQSADSKIFSRSLLAKSASIQTVFCVPFMCGVLELGTTELVSEDLVLIQQVTTSILELPNPVQSEQSGPAPHLEESYADVCANNEDDAVDTFVLENHQLMVEHQIPLEPDTPAFSFSYPPYTSNIETELILDKVNKLPANVCEEPKFCSPCDSSNNCCGNIQTNDSFQFDGLNGTSQVQSEQLMDDEFSNGLHSSLNSSNCMSQSHMSTQRLFSSPQGELTKNHDLDSLHEGDYSKLISIDLEGDDSHYTKTLAAILRNSKQLSSLLSPIGSHESSFTVWNSGLSTPLPFISIPQMLLKKILVDTVWTHGGQPLQCEEENGLRNRVWKSEGDEAGVSHVMSERRRREKLNEKFLILRSMIPSISKVDKASILGDTIEYLKKLERRVAELESFRELVELEARGRSRNTDVAERTSDNYGSKLPATKRKACDFVDVEAEHHWILSKNGPLDVNVTMTEKEVLIEMHCPWRECLLLEIVDTINNLHLDPFLVQSSTVDGLLALTLKAKTMGSDLASAGKVKQALKRVVDLGNDSAWRKVLLTLKARQKNLKAISVADSNSVNIKQVDMWSLDKINKKSCDTHLFNQIDPQTTNNSECSFSWHKLSFLHTFDNGMGNPN